MTDQQLIDALLAVAPKVQAAWDRAQIVNDVLNDAVLSRENGSAQVVTLWGKLKAMFKRMADPAAEGPTCAELYYLPKGKLEQPYEYAQRIGMTPWFPRTPQILADRQGALFSSPPMLDGKEAKSYEDFERSCTLDGKSLTQFCNDLSAKMQADGLGGILVDRAVLPEDVAERGGVISAEEAQERELGDPHWVLYQLRQVYDWEEDSSGLKSVKLVEQRMQRPDLISDEVKIITVRILDRVRMRCWEIIEEKTGKQTVRELPEFVHKFADENKKPVIPFSLGHAFRGSDGVGRPSLLGPAMADVSATRILSDINWTLFVVGNPVLTWTTHENMDDFETVQKRFSSNAGRFFMLRAGTQDKDGEQLEYAQLDATGLDRMMQMYERYLLTADEQAGKDAPGAMTQPVQEQSGISRAWEFKTGQERQLFLLTRALEETVNPALRIVANDMGRDPNAVTVKFNTDFDFGAEEKIDDSDKLLSIADRYDLKACRVAVLKEVFMERATTEEISKQMETEIEAAEKPEIDVETEQNSGKSLDGSAGRGGSESEGAPPKKAAAA